MTNAQKPDNPSAFSRPACATAPYDSGHNIHDFGEPGMTLRDYFAASALQGILSGDENALRKLSSETARRGVDTAAEIAYQFADAMLKARQK